MTLIEELEQAAFRADVRAQETTEVRDGVRWKHIRGISLDEAARLRKRVQRIKNAGEGHSHGTSTPTAPPARCSRC